MVGPEPAKKLTFNVKIEIRDGLKHLTSHRG
jgi:hypothetical protein